MSAFFLSHPRETDLALFSGGELGPLARWRIERHLESCESCQALVAEFFHLESELSPLAELPDLDWNQLAESIEARAADARATGAAVAEPRRAVPAWGMGLAAACAAAVVAVGLWNVDFGPEEPLAEVAASLPVVEAPQRSLESEPAPAVVGSAKFAADEAKDQDPPEPVDLAEADRAAPAPAAASAPVANLVSGSAGASVEQFKAEAPAAARERRQMFADAVVTEERRALPGDTEAPPPPSAPAAVRALGSRAERADRVEAEAVREPVGPMLLRAWEAGGAARLEKAMKAFEAREATLDADEARWLAVYRERGLDGLITALRSER